MVLFKMPSKRSEIAATVRTVLLSAGAAANVYVYVIVYVCGGWG